jgi:RTX calcium-binding nonapeptide repeat (4 copies)
MSLSWTLPLPVALAPGAQLSLSAILQQSFGSVPSNISGAWLEYYSTADLASWNFSYWNPASPSVGTWYVNGSSISPDTSTFESNATFGTDIFRAGNDIGDFAYVYLGSAWYSMITVAPNLIDMPANNHEPTAADVVAAAYRFNNYYGFVANDNDCHNIAMEVAASVGATLPYDSGSLDPTQNVDGGFWRVVYRGSQANPVSNWQTLVQPGDIVRMGWTAGGEHTTTVMAVNPDGSLVVYDNADYPSGTEGIGIHTVNYDTKTIASDITIYRLSTDNLYLQTGDNAGDTIFGTIFNNEIVGGSGNDTLVGGPGDDVFKDSGGTNSIDGRTGFNTVIVPFNAAQTTLTDSAGGSWTLNAPSLTDNMTNVELVQFNDSSWALRAFGNFRGNDDADIPWYDPTNGSVGFWSTQGLSPHWTPVGTGSPTMTIAGIGDFNGDGTSDILWENPTNNLVSDWLMNDGTPAWQQIGQGSTTMNIAGVGNFYGNGTSDILWQNPTNNLVGEWQMNNNVPTWQLVGQGSTTMNIAGIGDFNGDGTSDILWENPTNNLVGMWGMNGSTPSWSLIGQGSTTMQIVGVGDFTGSGTDDILWENPTNGTVGFWGMSNGQATSWNVVGTASTTYHVAGIGDYTGNGTDDILWRNPTTGDTGIWAMSNGQATWHDLGSSSTSFNVVKS